MTDQPCIWCGENHNNLPCDQKTIHHTLSPYSGHASRPRWQLISSAPQNETLVILGCVITDWVTVGYYVPTLGWIDRLRLPVRRQRDAVVHPSHWMPLPESPFHAPMMRRAR
jgi:hypothetical protein